MSPDRITLDDCDRGRMTVTGVCNQCGERSLTLNHDRQRKWWRTTVKRLFEECRLTCATCRAPFSSVRITAAGNLRFPGEVLGVWVK